MIGETKVTIIIISIFVTVFVSWAIIIAIPQFQIVENETLHACQQIHFDMINKLDSFNKSSATFEQIQIFNEKHDEFENQIKELQQHIINYDCEKTKAHWLTPEFKEKLKFFTDNNTLP